MGWFQWNMTADQTIIVVIGMVMAWLVGLGAGAKIEQMNHDEDAERKTAER